MLSRNHADQVAASLHRDLGDRQAVQIGRGTILGYRPSHRNEVADRRLQLCGVCGGYVKVMATAAPIQFPLVAIEDLASMDLDMVAIERRYMRPALPAIKKI